MTSEEQIERTFVMVKPDGVQRKLVGQIISRLENKGLEIRALRLKNLDIHTARKHYEEHKKKPFYDDLVYYITSGPILLMAIEGFNAVRAVRQLVGATNPVEALPGSLRGDFCLEKAKNLVHAADSQEAAERELTLHFRSEDYVTQTRRP
ncbi:MAG: nucleoside-diphosphate kinase [Halobacteriota archaeon]